MGYSKILPIASGAGHVRTAIHYAVRDDKAMLDVVVPSKDGTQTTAKIRYASTQHVSAPEWAAEEFALTRERFGKTGGRLAYQIIQSFSPDETGLTAEDVHQIGIELAKRLFPDHEAVIGTHVDRDHIHNHIIVNSVSLRDGSKIHLENGWIENVMWPASDEISRKHGAKLQTREQDKQPLTVPPEQRTFRVGTYAETIRRDMLCALRHATTKRELLTKLQQFGYEVDNSGQYTKIRPDGAQRFFRTDRIYSDKEFGKMHKWRPGPLGKLRGARKTLSHDGDHDQPSYWQLSILFYVQTLSDQVQHRRTDIPFREYRKLPERLDQFRYIRDNDIRSPEQLKESVQHLSAKLKTIRREGRMISKEKKAMRPLIEAVDLVDMMQSLTSRLPSQERRYQHAVQVIQKSGMSAEGIRTAFHDVEARSTANTRDRKQCFSELSLLRSLRGVLPRVRQAVQTKIQDILADRKLHREAPGKPQAASAQQDRLQQKVPHTAKTTIQKGRSGGRER